MGDDPDADILNFAAEFERELSADEVGELDPDQQYEYLLAWFFHYYEDPAHDTPHESAEGGYQYIFGGPYDAEEELSNKFGDAVSEEVMQRVVDRLQSVGFEWAPSDNHPARAYENEDETPLEDLDRIVAKLQDGSLELTPDPVGSANRQAVIDAASALQDALAKFTPPPIGHNHPPEDIKADEPKQDQVSEPAKDVTFAKEEAQASKPDLLGFGHALKSIRELGKLLLKGVVAAAGKALFDVGMKELQYLSPLIDSLVHAGVTWLASLAAHLF